MAIMAESAKITRIGFDQIIVFDSQNGLLKRLKLNTDIPCRMFDLIPNKAPHISISMIDGAMLSRKEWEIYQTCNGQNSIGTMINQSGIAIDVLIEILNSLLTLALIEIRI